MENLLKLSKDQDSVSASLAYELIGEINKIKQIETDIDLDSLFLSTTDENSNLRSSAAKLIKKFSFWRFI